MHMSRDTGTMAGRVSRGVPRSGGRTAVAEAPGGRRGIDNGAARREHGGAGRRADGGAGRRADGGAGRRAAAQYPVAGATALAPQRDVTVEHEAAQAHRVVVEPRRGTAAPQRANAAPRLQVAPPAPVSAPRAPFVALVLALVVAGVVGILVLNTKIVENAFTLHTLQERQSALDLQQQGLERDLAFKESPGQLAAAATRLGLVPSRTPAFIVLPDGRKLGVPQPGSAGARR